MEDKDKGAQIYTMLPFPLGLVKPKEEMTQISAKLERNGLIPIVVTFESTPSGKDCDELGELRFWPKGRVPLGQESDCVGGEDTEEESSEEGTFCSSEAASVH